MVVCACKSTMWEVEARRTGVQSHRQLRREFKTSLGYLNTAGRKEVKKDGERNKERSGRNQEGEGSRVQRGKFVLKRGRIFLR